MALGDSDGGTPGKAVSRRAFLRLVGPVAATAELARRGVRVAKAEPPEPNPDDNANDEKLEKAWVATVNLALAPLKSEVSEAVIDGPINMPLDPNRIPGIPQMRYYVHGLEEKMKIIVRALGVQTLPDLDPNAISRESPEVQEKVTYWTNMHDEYMKYNIYPLDVKINDPTISLAERERD